MRVTPAAPAAVTATVISGIRCYLSTGVWYAVGYGYNGTDWDDVGLSVTMTAVAGGGGVTLSGTNLTLASGTAATTKFDPTTVGTAGQVWYVALSAFDLDAPIATAYSITAEAIGSRPTVEDAYVAGWAASDVPSTASQVIMGAGPCYAATGKTYVYESAAGTTSESGFNANNDVICTTGVVGAGGGMIVGYNTARTTKGGNSTPSPDTAAFTHLCITAGVRGVALASDAVFGNFQVKFRKAAL